MQRHGWQGWTGSESKAGTAWRTRVIYRTNMATSYAAGRLAQLKAFPLWVYKHSGNENPRLQHKAWNGLTLPADHAFWKTHYPPNGWGCGCRVVGARSAEGAKRLGGKPDYDMPPAGWNVRDAKGRMPGIDEGWDYQPGATSRAIDVLDRKIATLPAPIGQALALTHRRYPLIAPDQAQLDEIIQSGRDVLDELLRRRLPRSTKQVPPVSQRGRTLGEALTDGWDDWTCDLLRRWVLEAAAQSRPMGGRLDVTGKGAKTIAARVARKLPADWIEAMNRLGTTHVIAISGRGYFRVGYGAAGLGPTIKTDDSSTAEHEFIHWMQAASPKLDALFQALHRRRTANDRLEDLYIVNGRAEVGRKDDYVEKYFGREYFFGAQSSPKDYDRGQALEVMTMAYQALLGEDRLANDFLFQMLGSDRELLALAIGALLRYKP